MLCSLCPFPLKLCHLRPPQAHPRAGRYRQKLAKRAEIVPEMVRSICLCVGGVQDHDALLSPQDDSISARSQRLQDRLTAVEVRVV